MYPKPCSTIPIIREIRFSKKFCKEKLSFFQQTQSRAVAYLFKHDSFLGRGMRLECKTVPTSEKIFAYNPTVFILVSRGGVEDTRLEAKAKDTKKIRGQGQPLRDIPSRGQ